MLGFTMRFKMRLFLYLLWACMVMTTFQLQCDPMTQYQKNDQCCKMCPPGTSISSASTCQEPQCKECEEGEYQDEYTKKQKCKRQRYCDPNLNFEVPVHRSKTEQSICMCKLGFHCSDKTCELCFPHSICKPGHEAKTIGNNSHDTVCEKCPEGTFSTISSWDSVCKPWTQCGVGYYIQQKGTAETDNICAKTSRTHIILISVFVSLIVIALVGFMYWRYRGNVKEKVKHYFCYDSFWGEEQNERMKDTCIVMPPQPQETKPMLPEQESTQEEYSAQEGHGMTPEENLDEESQEAANYTENGNYVTQEKGKSEILSRQESQTHSSVQTNSE